jgi:hypothetical protein
VAADRAKFSSFKTFGGELTPSTLLGMRRIVKKKDYLNVDKQWLKVT